MTIRTALAASLAALALTGTAFAADLPTRKAPPAFEPPAPAFTWTGFYIGGYAGGGFGSAQWTDAPHPGFTNGHDLGPSGFVGGGLIGYNFQTGPFVFGLEGEAGYNGVSASKGFLNHAGEPRSWKFEGGDVERVRGRIGYAFDNTLLYFAGGGSFADGRMRLNHLDTGPYDAISKSYAGFNVGGGAEYAFTSNWIGRIEYIYDDFGHETYNFDESNGFDPRRVSFTENTVRAAIEYKF
jgi:outer membrane immunogenic protein